MTKDALLTIIIGTYQREPKALESTLKSILVQQFLNWKVIILDDNKDLSISNKIVEMLNNSSFENEETTIFPVLN